MDGWMMARQAARVEAPTAGDRPEAVAIVWERERSWLGAGQQGGPAGGGSLWRILRGGPEPAPRVWLAQA